MANITITIDEKTKKQAEILFENFGLSVNSAIKMFLMQSIREQALPFTPKMTDDDIFYSKSNIDYIMQGVNQLNAKKGIVHELIEVSEND